MASVVWLAYLGAHKNIILLYREICERLGLFVHGDMVRREPTISRPYETHFLKHNKKSAGIIFILSMNLTDESSDDIIRTYDWDKTMTELQVAQKLGIKEQVRTPLDYVTLGDKGLPRKTILRLMDMLSISLIDLAPLLLVSRKTIERYRDDLKHNLNRSVSERVLRIALVVLRCEEVFGEKHVCNDWLKNENPALGNQSPLSLMRSDFGIELVLRELGRIEHGIIS